MAVVKVDTIPKMPVVGVKTVKGMKMIRSYIQKPVLLFEGAEYIKRKGKIQQIDWVCMIDNQVMYVCKIKKNGGQKDVKD